MEELMSHLYDYGDDKDNFCCTCTGCCSVLMVCAAAYFEDMAAAFSIYS